MLVHLKTTRGLYEQLSVICLWTGNARLVGVRTISASTRHGSVRRNVPSGVNSWRQLCPVKDAPLDDDDDDDDFHLCSQLGMLSRYTVLEVRAVRQPMRVCCGSRWGRRVLFINILDNLTVLCLAYNTAMYRLQYTAGAASTAGVWFIHLSLIHI